MAIRFSAARDKACPVIVRAMCPSVPLSPANDNVEEAAADEHSAEPSRLPLPGERARASAASDRILAEALRHFARHGLSAAAHARANAAAARLSGDEAACVWWIAICRQFDQSMADEFARRG